MGLGFAQRKRRAAAVVPDGARVYAIGDVHGRLDLLDRLLDRVADDAARAGHLAKCLVLLGDYVDRGPRSREVIDRVAGLALPGFAHVALKGNHEVAFLDVLDNGNDGANWMAYGGLATLASYGVSLDQTGSARQRQADAQARLIAAVPAEHRAFLKSLKTSVTIGDYFFTHAGVRPGVALDYQTESDLIWIREEFLASTRDHGKVVVHGHTVSSAPEIRANRIGIDTGAFATDRLTCLVLEGASRRFIAT